MDNYIISCCSTADLTEDHFNERNISYICFHFELDGKEYTDDLGKSISFNDFYEAMKNGAETKTSQVNVQEYEKYFDKLLSTGKDVLHISLSSGLSGTINSAMIAKSNLEDKYPDRKLYIIDSLAAASGYGLLVDKVADLRDEGKDIEEVVKWIDDNKKKLNHWFFSTDLTFYIKGGRVSKTSGFIGGLLGICPLLDMNNLGKLIPRYKIRSKNKVIKAIVDKMQENAENGLDYNDKCYISHSSCIEDAQQVVNLIEERFHNLKGKVMINNIGTTIGSHTGPGTVALFFWGKERGE